MINVNWMALFNIYRVFGIAVFLMAFLLRCIGKERKVKGLVKIANVLLALTVPLIVLAFLETIGINETIPVLGFSLYDFF